VLIHAFNWEKISVAALAYRWDGKRRLLYFQIRPGSYGAESLIAFLKELRHHFRSQRVILVWDGLPAHKSRIMKEYLESQRHWQRQERLPGYAPDLNPVAMLWGNIKGQELANRCSEGLGEAATAVCQGMARVRQSQQLPFVFLHHAGLSF
jgi:putative transposase